MLKKRQLLNNPILSTLAGVLLNGYGEFVYRTSRTLIKADPAVDRLLHEIKSPVVYAIWHCQVFSCHWCVCMNASLWQFCSVPTGMPELSG